MASLMPQNLVHDLFLLSDLLDSSCDEDEELELYHMVVMAKLEQTH